VNFLKPGQKVSILGVEAVTSQESVSGVAKTAESGVAK
jgi:hypothetical protein